MQLTTIWLSHCLTFLSTVQPELVFSLHLWCFTCFGANKVGWTSWDVANFGYMRFWAVLAWAMECWLHIYIFKPHYFENLPNCRENCWVYVWADLIEIFLLDLGHIDINLKVSCAVHNCCFGKFGNMECDNIVCKAFWFIIFCSTAFPVVFGDKAGYDITKAPIGNTATAEVYD